MKRYKEFQLKFKITGCKPECNTCHYKMKNCKKKQLIIKYKQDGRYFKSYICDKWMQKED